MGMSAAPGSLDGRRQPLGKMSSPSDGGALTGEGVHKMVKLSLRKLAAAVGGVAVAMTAAAGVASADPLDPVVNTTCDYGQVMAALNAIGSGGCGAVQLLADRAGLLASIPGITAAEARADGPTDPGHAVGGEVFQRHPDGRQHLQQLLSRSALTLLIGRRRGPAQGGRSGRAAPPTGPSLRARGIPRVPGSRACRPVHLMGAEHASRLLGAPGLMA